MRDSHKPVGMLFPFGSLIPGENVQMGKLSGGQDGGWGECLGWKIKQVEMWVGNLDLHVCALNKILQFFGNKTEQIILHALVVI